MRRPFAVSLLLGLLVAGCAPGTDSIARTGTPELRAALFDTILVRTARREAFSAPKNAALDFDPLEDMRALRDDVTGATTETELYYALSRLSQARRDRHLEVLLVEGGLRPDDTAGLAFADAEGMPPPAAPIRILPDYSGDSSYFVADVAGHPALAGGPGTGDRIVALSLVPVEDWAGAARPYIRHSTVAGLRWKTAEAMTQRSAVLPPEMRYDSLVITFTTVSGELHTRILPFLEPSSIDWRGESELRYPGFSLARSTGTFDLYRPDDGRPLLVLVWHGFGETLIEDVDSLVAFGADAGLLDHALIIDVTRSRGGSLGAYALQRLQPKPFRTTFGTLRLSDVVPSFIARVREAFAAGRVLDRGVPETIDSGAWLMDWLETDVTAALERGDSVTEPVPFKLAHAPRTSDGILQPAPVHFRGPLVVLSGPSGGSHLDQFLAIVVDNDLGHVIGMPAGGYSNTWEWQETLTFPGTDQPVVAFMWSIGHTIRPNGEVLEGNPAAVDEWLPLTRENSSRYYTLLFDRALAHLADIGFSATAPPGR